MFYYRFTCRNKYTVKSKDTHINILSKDLCPNDQVSHLRTPETNLNRLRGGVPNME